LWPWLLIATLQGGQPAEAGRSPSNRAAVSFAVFTPGKSKQSQKAGFALSKPLQRPLVRSTMRAASGLMLSLHRRTFRCDLALPISVSNSERGFPAETTNVSMGGIAIQTREALAPDEEFKIEFTLPNGFEFKADAMVVWTGKLGRAALRITGMQNSARDGLQDWIDTQIEKDQGGHRTKATSSHELAPRNACVTLHAFQPSYSQHWTCELSGALGTGALPMPTT
jgi:hypothetical protein